MPRIAYIEKRFAETTLSVIDTADQIIGEYTADGYDITLRQLYYQFVARGLIENTHRAYKRLGSAVRDGRLAGLLDWNVIVDRTRNVQEVQTWNNPREIADAAAQSYREDKWAEQSARVEVWIEKDALLGVISGKCQELEVPFFSCRGYVSSSEMWQAAQRHGAHERIEGQEVFVIHLGDHDPSGVDMTRDIQDRLRQFGAWTVVERVALTMEQIEEYSPPPNPVKVTDSRMPGYFTRYGLDSWELDALEPRVMVDLIDSAVRARRDAIGWDESMRWQEKKREVLEKWARSIP